MRTPSLLSWPAAPQLHLKLHLQQRQSPSLTLLLKQPRLQVRQKNFGPCHD